jgi:hypothetical protein
MPRTVGGLIKKSILLAPRGCCIDLDQSVEGFACYALRFRIDLRYAGVVVHIAQAWRVEIILRQLGMLQLVDVEQLAAVLPRMALADLW